MEGAMSLAEDMLKGAKRIADFTGFNEREIYDLARANALPVFKVGKHLCARKSELRVRLSGHVGAAE
jgi:hypothetical protein